jgi:malate/lactate dehydrogenase
MKMNRQWLVVLGLSLGMLLPISLKADPGTGGAEGGPGGGARNGACRDDIEKFCKDVQKGGGRIAQCLKQHESELSEGCQQQIAARKEARKEKGEQIKEACKDDAQKFCKDVKPGGGRIIRCLKEHESELSAGCQETLPKKKN